MSLSSKTNLNKRGEIIMANKNMFIGYDDDLQFNKPYRCPYCFSHGIIKYNVNLSNYEYNLLYPVGEKNTEYLYYDVQELMEVRHSLKSARSVR